MAESVVVEIVTDPTPTVIEAVAALEESTFGRGGLNEWHLPVIARRGRLYIARVGETEMVGAASLIRSWEDSAAFLFDLVVEREWRRRGVGRRLMTAIVEGLKTDGIRRLELTVAPENDAALALYRGFGLNETAFFPQEYGGGMDRVMLTLVLEDSDDRR